MFATSPVGSIWLEMSINWHTTSQGPKKKSIQITKRRIDPCPAHTARNKGSFTTMVLWTVNPFCPQLYFRALIYRFTFHFFSLYFSCGAWMLLNNAAECWPMSKVLALHLGQIFRYTAAQWNFFCPLCTAWESGNTGQQQTTLRNQLSQVEYESTLERCSHFNSDFKTCQWHFQCPHAETE